MRSTRPLVRIAVVIAFALFATSWTLAALLMLDTPLRDPLFSMLVGDSAPTKSNLPLRPPARPLNWERAEKAAFVYMYEERPKRSSRSTKAPTVAPAPLEDTFEASVVSEGRPPPLPPPPHRAACSPAPPSPAQTSPCCRPAISWLEGSLIRMQAMELARLFALLPSLARISLSSFLQPLIAASLCDDDTAYVITGDIRPMWLRDSVGQVQPYLEALGRGDLLAAHLFRGIIRRQAHFLIEDIYGNAFRLRPKGALNRADEKLGRTPLVATRNFETDSPAYFLLISGQYWNATRDKSLFVDDPLWLQAAERVVELFRLEQNHGESPYSYPELVNQGRGPPCAYTGMTWSGFRPSDEPCIYSYLIPSNILVEVGLQQVVLILKEAFAGTRPDVAALGKKASRLANQIDAGIHRYGVVRNTSVGAITSALKASRYAFETDGFGNHLLIDDANVPSLLSVPYLRYFSPRDSNGAIMKNTRRFILSQENTYFLRGDVAEGIGSSHTPGLVWPMSIIMRAMSSDSPTEILECVRQLVITAENTSAIHESFDPSHSARFTRPWFSWAASLFAEMVWRRRTLISRNLDWLAS